MTKQAYISGFLHKCLELNVNPGPLLKKADWFNKTTSRFDAPIYKELGRTVRKGFLLPFLFPSQRRFDVHPGDTYTNLSSITGIPVSKLTELNGGRPLIAGSTVRVE